MMTRIYACALIFGALPLGWVLAQSRLETDEQILRTNKLPTDTEELLNFFRQRSLKDGDTKTIQGLVQQLGSDAYQVRERAAKRLVLRGFVAMPFLQAALKNSPLEMKRRAELCIRDIEATMQLEVIAAAARVLEARKPPRGAETILNFLPSIGNDQLLEEEILATLGRMTVEHGQADPLISRGLEDPVSFRRAASAYVLGRRGDIEYRQRLRQLLADPDPQVAVRAAQGILGKRPAHVLEESFSADEALLTTQKIERTPAAVLDFFRKRTLGATDQMQLRALVKELGAKSYTVRENAFKHLLKEGPPALPFLKEAEFDDDVERSRRARDCVALIRQANNTAVPIAAVHWLARRQTDKNDAPGEAIGVLLAYVPFVDDEMVEDEILTGLTLLGVSRPTLDPQLVKGLDDPSSPRRAAAAYVVGHVGGREHVARVKALLDDQNPLVRLRAAQGMLAARDKAALTCLAQLVETVPTPYLSRVEEALYRVADDKGPTDTIIATSLESRQKASRDWLKWLETTRELDLANLGEQEGYLGLITICEYDNRFGNIGGQIWETNHGDQKRWSFSGVMGAMDARALPNGRVLVAENNAMRVTERDSHGAVKWEYRVPNNPICCQRLPNGNTFIASYNMVMEVKPSKEQVYRYTPGPQFYIFSAHKARNGHIVAITAQGQIIEMDSRNGQTIHTVQTNTLGNWCSVEMQANGNFLVASMSTNTVREIDRKGNELWSKPFPGAFRATRLPNGNVLVASMSTREVAELDRNGSVRWRTTCTGRPWSVHYR